MENVELYNSLMELYKLLREEGFGRQLTPLNKLIYSLETNDLKGFKKVFKSRDIWGGAGSIRDISIRDVEKQNKIDTFLRIIKEQGKHIR